MQSTRALTGVTKTSGQPSVLEQDAWHSTAQHSVLQHSAAHLLGHGGGDVEVIEHHPVVALRVPAHKSMCQAERALQSDMKAALWGTAVHSHAPQPCLPAEGWRAVRAARRGQCRCQRV